MNKKIFISAVSILTSLAMLGGSAYAAFIVNATSNGSTFSSGTPALELCNDVGGAINTSSCANQIASPISVTDLIPGTPQTFAFWLDNTGTDALTPLTAVFANPSITGGLESDLNVSLSCDTNSNSASVSQDTFHNWETTKTLTNGSIASGVVSRCVMTVELPSGNTTDAAQTLNFNATFSGSDGS